MIILALVDGNDKIVVTFHQLKSYRSTTRYHSVLDIKRVHSPHPLLLENCCLSVVVLVCWSVHRLGLEHLHLRRDTTPPTPWGGIDTGLTPRRASALCGAPVTQTSSCWGLTLRPVLLCSVLFVFSMLCIGKKKHEREREKKKEKKRREKKHWNYFGQSQCDVKHIRVNNSWVRISVVRSRGTLIISWLVMHDVFRRMYTFTTANIDRQIDISSPDEKGA